MRIFFKMKDTPIKINCYISILFYKNTGMCDIL